MNTYPAELLQHHYACMLVSGLLPSQSQISSPEGSRSSLPLNDQSEGKATTSSPPKASSSSSSSSQASSSRIPTPAQAFPQVTKDLCEIFSSRGRNSAWDPSKSQSDVFHTVLVDNNVRLPPKKTRPTPRTLNATAIEQQSSLASLQPRSPLSPLHPSSPLFPDGLIAPIWIRKHRELVPSVFVSFYCLTEQIIEPAATTEGKSEDGEMNGDRRASMNGTIAERLSGPELKKRDEDLIRVISDRKRSLSERGIKFTVVLLTTRAMLESPSLESRLSYIRRSSQLDSKASLFVLTPVSRNDLGDFVTSLQGALYEPAQDYYREHYRRARKKRARYPPPSSTVSQIMTAAAEIRGTPIKDAPLSKEGWLARNDYKLATFAELMTKDQSDALGHYLSAYQTLANDLLASTMLLPPRTKRWAEAKVLSDCINFKICKIYLYRNNGESAWYQFKSHIKRFTDLSQGWGIGEMTFEFWSWLGKQYRLMSDLLDLATKEVPGAPLPPFQLPVYFPAVPTILLHPSHLPTPTANGHFPPSHNPQHGNLVPPNELAINSHSVPADLCQGAGTCFYIAGICAMERWQRFRRMLWEEENNDSKKEDGAWSTLTQEKKVDHAAQAIEVFTKAHEIFKRQRLQRQSLLVASKIAYAYVEAEQYEMALRFLERILKTIQAEGWPAQAMSLLLLTLECAQKSKNVESEGRALWLLLSLKSTLSSKQRQAALEAMSTWQEALALEEGEKKILTVESSGKDGALTVEYAFARSQIDLDDQGSLFQIRISCPPGFSLPNVTFDSLQIYFSGQASPFVINHKDHKDHEEHQTSTLKDIGELSLGAIIEGHVIGTADLRWWSEGLIRAFQGVVVPDQVGTLQVERICLLGKGGVDYCLEFHLAGGDEDLRSSYSQDLWMVTATPPRFIGLPYREHHDGLVVRKTSHRVYVDVSHNTEAYLEESFPVTLKIKNNDAVALQCFVEAFVQGQPQDISPDHLWLQGKKPTITSSRLDEVEIGLVESDSTLSQIVFVSCRHHLRPRNIEVIVKTVIPGDHTEGRTSETFRTLEVPVKTLFAPAFHANWRIVKDNKLGIAQSQSRRPSITISNVDETGSSEGSSEVTLGNQMEGEGQGTTSIAGINVSLATLSKDNITMEGVTLVLDEASKHLRIASGVADQHSQRHAVSSTWSNGDRWGNVFDVEVRSESNTGFAIEGDDGTLRPTGQLQIEWRRETSPVEGAETNISTIDVPLLAPPHLLPRIVVSIPPITTMEQPLVMLLSLVNPSKLSSEIFVSVEDNHSDFGVLSHKTFTVPLIGKSTRSVPVHVLSKSSKGSTLQGGIQGLPKVRAWQRDRKVKRDEGGDEQNSTTTTTTTTMSSSNTTTTTIPIMNHQRGGGLPLEVQLRYTKTNAQQSNGNQNSIISQLQAETVKTGAWTIFVHSSTAEVAQ